MQTFNERLWFNWQQPASPLLLGSTFDACGTPFREFFGFPCFTSVLYYRTLEGRRGYQASWLLRVGEGEACGRLLVDLLASPSFRQEFDTLVGASFEKVVAEANALAADDLGTLTDDGFVDRWVRFHTAFVDFYRLGAITEPVQWYAATVVNNFLADDRDRATSLLTEGWGEDRARAACFAMTAEPYVMEIERDLAVVAVAFDAARGRHADQSDLARDRGLAERIEAHIARYGWKGNNYRDVSTATIDEVIAELISLVEGGSAVERLRHDLDAAELRRQEMIADRAHLLARAPDMIRTVVRIGDEYGAGLADRRKATMLPALIGADALGRELARRTSITYDLIKLLTPTEVQDLLADRDGYRDRLQARTEALVLVQAPFPIEDAEMAARLSLLPRHERQVPRKDDITLAEGADALQLLDHIDLGMGLFTQDRPARIARGDVIVRPPEDEKLEGMCRVVTDPRTDPFDAGEILVATSTTPNFMPAIRKASALVVDQGGTLSHAAITSRELGKPCIVGAAVATALFHTGDRIIIDFSTGTVSRAEGP